MKSGENSEANKECASQVQANLSTILLKNCYKLTLLNEYR